MVEGLFEWDLLKALKALKMRRNRGACRPFYAHFSSWHLLFWKRLPSLVSSPWCGSSVAQTGHDCRTLLPVGRPLRVHGEVNHIDYNAVAHPQEAALVHCVVGLQHEDCLTAAKVSYHERRQTVVIWHEGRLIRAIRGVKPHFLNKMFWISST